MIIIQNFNESSLFFNAKYQGIGNGVGSIGIDSCPNLGIGIGENFGIVPSLVTSADVCVTCADVLRHLRYVCVTCADICVTCADVLRHLR